MDILDLIDQLEDMIQDSSSIPLTGKVMLNKNDLLDMLQEIRLKLPDEFKQAKWITEEKQRILIEAQKQAEAILKETDARLKREIEHHDITEEANRRAAEIINNAQKKAKDIRLGAREYANQLLEDLEKNIDTSGKALSLKMQNDTAELLNKVQSDVVDIIKSIEGNVSEKATEIKENIKELKKIN
ncbi:MAG: ATPase [Clostridiales bacterium]|nr:ATPase [Clostridiales bacterium]